MIYKIKIIPKRKSKQVYSGYIYIVDGLWNIHSTNVNTEAFFGTVNIKQVYAPVKDNAWLPISHQVALAGSIMGVKGKYNYARITSYNVCYTKLLRTGAYFLSDLRQNQN